MSERKEIYKKVFQIPRGPLTSMVMDQEDFDEFCDKISKLNVHDIGEEQVEKIREAKHMPMMGRGTKTQGIFDEYEIETDLISVVVRGYGPELAEKMGLNDGGVEHIASDNAAALACEALKTIPEDAQKDIQDTAKKLMDGLLKSDLSDIENDISTFIKRYGMDVPRAFRLTLIEQTFNSLGQTFVNTKQIIDSEAWPKYFEGYLQRLLIGVCHSLTNITRN